jgi:hypothetical protein
MMASAANKAVVSADSRDFGYLIALTPTKTVFSYPTDMLILQLGNKQA